MAMKLEEGLAARIPVPKGKRDVMVYDTETPGFFLRKFATGRAMYGVKFSVAGKERKVHLYDATIKGVLAKARKEACDVRAKARLGTDVVAAREAAKTARQAEAKQAENTLGIVVKKYLAVRATELRHRSFLEVKRHLEKQWKPLHARPIHNITRDDITARISEIVGASGKVAADRAATSLSTLFVWAIDEKLITGSPFIHIKRKAKNAGRKRKLTVAELRGVWLAAGALDDKGKRLVNEDYARIIKLLVLTGQRKGEIGGLDRSEIIEGDTTRGDHIDLPEERTKNHLPHLVPLSTQAMACLPAKRNSTKLFGRFDKGYTGWSKSKRELDAAILANRHKTDPDAQPMPAWVVHDLRRTFSTLLRELKLADTHLVELILNHVSGTRGGVAGVYDQSERYEERRKAMEAWGRYVEELVR